MKKTLFTALVLATGVFMQTSFAEEAPALQPPTTAHPYKIRMEMDSEGVVMDYSVGFTVPFGKLSKVEGIDALKGSKAVDNTGICVKSNSYGCVSSSAETSVDLSCGFGDQIPAMPYFSPDTPYLDVHAKLKLSTGDAVTAAGPVSLDIKKDKEITLGGTTYSVSFEPEEDGFGRLTFRAKGEATELLSVTRDDYVRYLEREASRSKKGGKAKEFEYGVWVSLEDEAEFVVDVRSYTLANPHDVQVPLDYRVSTEPLYKVEFRMPEDVGFQPLLITSREAIFQESVQGWAESTSYELRLEDKELSFLPMEDLPGCCCGEEDEAVPPAPSIEISKWVAEPDFSCKKPHLDSLKTLKVEVKVASPDAYEGEIQEERTITAEVAKLGKRRMFVLKADGQPHETKHGEFTIRYTLAAQEDEDGCRNVEYSCEGPDGDSGVRLLCNADVSEGEPKEETDSSTGATIRRTSFKGKISEPEDQPIMLMLLPYTERRTISIPVSISGKSRNPFAEQK